MLRILEHSHLDLDDLRAFFVVAETGSFARAAQRLDTSKSILSRRVARLEEMLGARLLQRSARGTLLTEPGQIYCNEAKAAVAQLECAAENLSQAVGEVSGPIRLTGPMYFGTEYLTPALCDFSTQYPGIELEVDFSDEKIDITREGFDIAVRTGYLPNSSLSLRRLCSSRRMVVASPAYLASHPRITQPEDLGQHRIVHYNGLNTQDIWRYDRDGHRHNLKVKPCLRSNSGELMMQAVAAGLGVTALPFYVTGAALKAGTVVEILTDWDWGTSPISLLMPPGRGTTRRVKALADFLVTRFQNQIV